MRMLEDLQSRTPAKLTFPDCRLPTLALDAQVHLLPSVREAV